MPKEGSKIKVKGVKLANNKQTPAKKIVTEKGEKIARRRRPKKAVIIEKAAKEEVFVEKIKPKFNSLAIYEREERKKIIMMWVGVGVFMFLIAGYWIYDTSRFFRQQRLSSEGSSDFSFDKLGDAAKDVSNRIDEFKQELKETAIISTTSPDVVATSSATSSDLTGFPVSEDVISTSSALISSTTQEEPVAVSEVPKPDLIVKELQEKLIASSSEKEKIDE